MDRQSVVRHLVRTLVPGALALGFALAGAGTPQAALSITVHADHYVAAQQVFGDLGALETAALALHPDTISLDACGPGVTRALMAAVDRFQHLPLQIRVLAPGEPGCALAGSGPRGIDDATVERYWRELTP